MRVSPVYLYLLHPVLSIVQNTELAFKEFIKKYNKAYNSPEEYNIAMRAFANSIREIEELRANSEVTHEVGLNEYSDMPNISLFKINEREDNHVSLEPTPNITGFEEVRVLNKLPPSIDWSATGDIGPVRNQASLFKSCGCCYAMVATAVMESRFKIQAGRSKVVPLSVQQIVECSEPEGNRGCDGGEHGKAYVYAHKNGMIKESNYPYKAKKGTCKTSIVNDPKKQCFKKGDLSFIQTVNAANEALMMKAVSTGPVAVNIYADSPAFEKYKSGIITATACGKGPNNHSVVIVGYGTSSKGIPYWKIMNSWGTSWGMKGFGYIERTGTKIPQGACGLLSRGQKFPFFSKDSIKDSPCVK